ncbi:MAG: AI-2E family transporter [Firmicutes bacterium]|nr:AI-2E family transporter [Bacillota bacterium]
MMGLFGKKRSSDKVDYDKLNELIIFSRNFMKFIFSVSIVALVVLLTYIAKEWNLFSIVGDILSILSPFFIGIILAWLLDPIVDFFQKKGVKRGIGATFVYVLLIVLIFVLGRLLMPTLIDQINDMIAGAPDIIKSLTEHFEKFTGWISKTYNVDGEIIKSTVNDVVNNLLYTVTVDGPSLVVSILSSIVSGGIDILLGFLIGFYMLLDFDDVKVQLAKVIPNKHRDEVTELTTKLNKTLRNFVYGTLVVMFILFICQSIGMSIAGISSPLVFALFCAITNIIPYLGPYIGGAPAVVIGFTMSPSIGLGVFISVLVCQLLESYLLTPVIQSKTMKLHPVTIIIGLLLFSHFFGIIGMLFATPVIACGKIIINFFIEKFDLFDEVEAE